MRTCACTNIKIGDYIFLIHTKHKLACEYFLYICMGFIFNDNTMF